MASDEKKSIKSRIIDILVIVASICVLGFAYLVFKGKVPKNLTSIRPYFYILTLIGIIGMLGERLATSFLSFILPFCMIGATLALKFNPKTFPIEEWWEIYATLAFITTIFLIYLFFRYDKNKGSNDIQDLHGRVDPLAAAKYKAEQEKKKLSEDPLAKLDPNAKEKANEIDKQVEAKVESVEERAEREIRTIREEFSKKSTRLTTTMMRIKGLTKSLDRDQIFDNIVKTIAKGLDASKVQLLLNDEKEQQFHVVQAVGMNAVEYKNIHIPYSEECMITYMLHSKSNSVSGSAGSFGTKEADIDPKTKGLIGQGTLKTIICAPIFSNDKLFAVLNVEQMENPDYTRDDQNLLTTCAEVSGLVMKNARLYSATLDDLVSAKQLNAEQLEKNEQLKNSLSRIVSPSVAEMIMSDPDALKLGGNKCEVTMFFSDIRGFTKMSENMDPTDIVEQLNVYFTKMTDILMELNGTLDKYVGDELMALFGAPVARPDDPIRAVLCGVKMLEALYELQKQWEKENKPIIKIGIGINTGIVTAGYMGSEKALSYTVIGDNVNLAARIMAQAKGMEMFITKATYERVKDYFEIEQRESIMVKGKSMPIEIYCVTGTKPNVDFAKILNLSVPSAPISLSPVKEEKPKEEEKEIKPAFIPDNLTEEQKKQNIKIDKVKPIVCQKCGNENDPQEKFCPKCGMPVF